MKKLYIFISNITEKDTQIGNEKKHSYTKPQNDFSPIINPFACRQLSSWPSKETEDCGTYRTHKACEPSQFW